MIITEVQTKDQLVYEYNMKEGLENITVNNLNDKKVKIINEMLRGDKRLSLETINSYN